MSLDRLIYFEKKLDVQEIKDILINYLDQAGSLETISYSLLVLTLQGSWSFPFKSIYPEDGRIYTMENEPRHIELHLDVGDEDGSSIDVLTRMADEYTNNVADGIASMLHRFYEGKFESELEDDEEEI